MTVAMKPKGPCFNNDKAIWKKLNGTAHDETFLASLEQRTGLLSLSGGNKGDL
jgi:hypothetical protein